jgi:hypothetical protein
MMRPIVKLTIMRLWSSMKRTEHSIAPTWHICELKFLITIFGRTDRHYFLGVGF